MTATYALLGRQVPAHYLAMATLTTLFGGTYAALSGGSKKKAPAPPINASSSDEADFIKKFMDEADQSTKKEKH